VRSELVDVVSAHRFGRRPAGYFAAPLQPQQTRNFAFCDFRQSAPRVAAPMPPRYVPRVKMSEA
jgi:hypothetical protein